MSQQRVNEVKQRFSGGIADFPREGQQDSFAFAQSIDFRSDPRTFKLLPRSIKESGSQVTGLIKWAETFDDSLVTYMYDEFGTIYSRDPLRYYRTLTQVPDSHGNGLVYSAEDNSLWYAGDTTIGRYGPLIDGDYFYEDWSNGFENDWNNYGGSHVTTDGTNMFITTRTGGSGYYGIEQNNYNMIGAFATVQLVNVGSRSLITYQVIPISIAINSSNRVYFRIDADNSMRIFSIVAGVPTTIYTGVYSSVNHKFFRIRETAGELFFDVSADNNSFTNLDSMSNPFDLTEVNIGMEAGTSGSEATTTFATFGSYITGRIVPNPSFNHDYFGSVGGVPLNTNSILLNGTTQYLTAVDSASLSIVSDIALDYQINPSSLPAVGQEYVIASKWNKNSDERSYKLFLTTASGYFGDSTDGALVISSNTTDAPIDSACSGASASLTLTATNVSFASGQMIYIHQTQGTGAGTYQINKIVGYTAGTISLDSPLNATYGTGAQVLVLKQYTNVTVNTGITWTAKAWNGTVGGILSFLASGTVTVTGTITATGKGFRGGSAFNDAAGSQGEGTLGIGTQLTAANSEGGGGGASVGSANPAGGGGGGHATVGVTANTSGGGAPQTGGTGGAIGGSSSLTTMIFGGGGGGAGSVDSTSGDGGPGGGIVFIVGTTVNVTGSVVANGANGVAGTAGHDNGGGGAGAGGSALIKAQIASIGTALITASGGVGGANVAGGTPGGDGSVGRSHADYYLSITGSTTTPVITTTQDNSLVINTSTQLRLALSSTGLNEEVLSVEANVQTDTWQQIGVNWNAASKTAEFNLAQVSLGTRTGTLGAIYDGTSLYAIGASFNAAGAAENLFPGNIDEAKVFNVNRSISDFIYGSQQQISPSTTGLVAYHQLNGDYTDQTANNNDLTPVGTPVFSSSVPFASPTTRLDIDQSVSTTGQTYTLGTSLSESATSKLSFTPSKDPQKSIELNIDTVGTGDWTVVIHDSNNTEVARVTVDNADLHVGDYEFVFDRVWRPLTNFNSAYHAHVFSTVGNGEVVTGVTNDFETADFTTYFQFLVEQRQWHPMLRFQNFWVVGNERYLGRYEAPLYNPNHLVFQGGMNVRCLALYREYLAIGVTRGKTVRNFELGRIYFWDGIAPIFNFFIDVPEGGINAMIGSRGKLYVWAGYKNQLLVFEGGDSAIKVKDMPNIATSDYSEIFPQAVTMWKSLLRYGVAGDGNSPDLKKGVYTYGSTNVRYPEVLTYDYPISTGGTNEQGLGVGMVTAVKEELLFSWEDSGNYGVDYINESNPPFETGYVTFLISNGEDVIKEKANLEIVAYFKSLEEDEGVEVGYAHDGSETFITNADPIAEGDELTRQIVTNTRYHEVQAKITLTADQTSPLIKGVAVQRDPLTPEKRY